MPAASTVTKGSVFDDTSLTGKFCASTTVIMSGTNPAETAGAFEVDPEEAEAAAGAEAAVAGSALWVSSAGELPAIPRVCGALAERRTALFLYPCQAENKAITDGGFQC